MGILVFHLWLARSSKYWYDMQAVLYETQAPVRVYFLMRFVVAAIISTSVGAFANAEFYSSRYVSDRLPYLGVFGNALIWLGVALSEVTVTLYLSWRRQGRLSTSYSSTNIDTWGDFGGEVVSLIVLEANALAAVVTARLVFVKAKRMMLRLKGLKEVPSTEGQVGRFGAAEPGGRRQQTRSRNVLLFVHVTLFCLFALTGWRSFVQGYQYASDERQDPGFEMKKLGSLPSDAIVTSTTKYFVPNGVQR